ncbi:MAG: filamentous hemagglutinin N-terminal domain-containing protein [Phormidesmis sp.]
MNYASLHHFKNPKIRVLSRTAQASLSSVVTAFLLGLSGTELPASAQITSDGTFSTTITPSNNDLDFLIENGNSAGTNLFHSFEEFSIPQGGSAHFNNGTDVKTIFGRVTGNNLSTINGLLQANGNADLFLMNPNGIVFGSQATLDVGGSFVATTANEILFNDQTRLTTDTAQASILTISAPVGLQLLTSPAAIEVNGAGHNLTQTGIASAVSRGTAQSALQVNTGKVLSLIGGSLALEGATLIAEAGHIELAAVEQGQIDFDTTKPRWQFDYDAATQLGKMTLAAQSLVDASEPESNATSTNSGNANLDTHYSGDISLVGENITLSDASVVLLQNRGDEASGNIRIQANDTLEVIGNNPAGDLLTGFKTQATGSGRAGDIELQVHNLRAVQGAEIESATYGAANSGDISVKASGMVSIEGFSQTRPDSSTTVSTLTASSGNAGNMTINADQVSISNGGNLISFNIPNFSSGGNGDSGNLTLTAKTKIEVTGDNNITQVPSSLSVVTLSDAKTGNLSVEAPQIEVRDGGRIGTTTFASGTTGSLTLTAPESLTVSGIGNSAFNPSFISASANILDPFTRALFGLPDTPSGQSGDLVIHAGRVNVTEGAQITVRHDGTGDSGSLRIDADTVFLNGNGGITASTESGKGGNIQLELDSALILRDNSQVSAEANGLGNGGNIVMEAPVILGLENSDIIANAVQGNGGNISIKTQGILGLMFQDELTPENDITASSEFGVSGTIEIENLAVDSEIAVTKLPESPTDVDNQIVAACASTNANQFIASGRGGLQTNPQQLLTTNRPWVDFRHSAELTSSASHVNNNEVGHQRLTQLDTNDLKEDSSEFLVEALTWGKDANGQIALLAESLENTVSIEQASCLTSSSISS